MNNNPNIHTEEEITQILLEAMESFNDVLDFNISLDNTVIAFFTPQNGVEIYERFCNENFPNRVHDNYKADGYFESMAASAFVGSKYGILIRSDLKWSSYEYFRVFLHEISHIFCTVNEIEGGEFYDKYCQGSGIEDGIINAGYAVWREAIADITVDAVCSDMALISLKNVRNDIVQLYDMISSSNPNSKKCMSIIIAYLMISSEVAGTENWDEAEKAIRNNINFKDDFIYRIAEIVFKNLNNGDFWTITLDFIVDLGETYISLLTNKFFN